MHLLANKATREPAMNQSLNRPVLKQTDGRQPTGAAMDSARQNLASTFVNAFVNAGFGHDKLVTAATPEVCNGLICALG